MVLFRDQVKWEEGGEESGCSPWELELEDAPAVASLPHTAPAWLTDDGETVEGSMTSDAHVPV